MDKTLRPISVKVSSSKAGLSFTAPGTIKGHVYRLAAQLDRASSCKNAIWRFPPFGFVVGGGPKIHVTVHATPQLQVYAGATSVISVDGAARDNWAVSDDINPGDPSGTSRLFHWASTAPATAKGTWEVALSAFGPGCGAPAGLLASGAAPFAPGPLTADKLDTSFAIDFGALAKTLAKPPPGQPADSNEVGPKLFGSYSPTTTATAAGHASSVQGAPPAQPQPIPYVGVFYVRVVPHASTPGTDTPGPHPFGCLGPSSNQVVIHYDQSGVVPGGPSSLQIYNSASYALISPDFPQAIDPGGWSTSAKLDWTPTGTVAHLIWSSAGPDTDHGEWQLSTLPYNPGSCPDSPGLLATGNAPFAAGPYNLGLRTTPPSFDIPIAQLAAKLMTSKTYYLRVVPRAVLGSTCTAKPTNQVTLSWTATPPPSGQLLPPPPPPPPPLAPLQLQIVKYQPFHPPDQAPPFCFSAIADHDLKTGLDTVSDTVAFLAVAAGHAPHFSAGEQHICFNPPPPQDPSFWDQVVNVVLDIVSFPAQVYETYKEILPGIIGAILTELNIADCNQGTACYQALYSAEEAGLAAVGLPPSLPDAKAILSDGEDYLAQQIADSTPISKSVAKAAIEKAKDQIAGQLAAVSTAVTGFDCGAWCIVDSGARTPEIAVRVTRPAADTSALPTDTKVCVKATYLYEARCAPLPANIKPGDTFVVPMPLAPDFSSGKVQSAYTQAYDDCQNPPSQLWELELPCESYAKHAAFGSWNQLFDQAGSITFSAAAGRSTAQQPLSATAQVTLNAQNPF